MTQVVIAKEERGVLCVYMRGREMVLPNHKLAMEWGATNIDA